MNGLGCAQFEWSHRTSVLIVTQNQDRARLCLFPDFVTEVTTTESTQFNRKEKVPHFVGLETTKKLWTAVNCWKFALSVFILTAKALKLLCFVHFLSSNAWKLSSLFELSWAALDLICVTQNRKLLWQRNFLGRLVPIPSRCSLIRT